MPKGHYDRNKAKKRERRAKRKYTRRDANVPVAISDTVIFLKRKLDTINSRMFTVSDELRMLQNQYNMLTELVNEVEGE